MKYCNLACAGLAQRKERPTKAGYYKRLRHIRPLLPENLPDVWSIFTARYPSRRWKQVQQRNKQLDEVVRLLSHQATLGDWQKTVESTVSMQGLRFALSQQVADVPEALFEIQKVWKSLSHQEARRAILMTGFGDMNRKARVAALGDGVVPQQALLAWRLLTEGRGHDSGND